MDAQEMNLTRVKFAVVALGTNMLQLLFEKYEDFQLRAKIQAKLSIRKFQPGSMGFKQLYDLCTCGFLRKAVPTEPWEISGVKPGDISLGDDIKRLKWLFDFLPTIETDLLSYKSHHEEICKMFKDIIKRFSNCEQIDCTEIFNNIMNENNIEELRRNIDDILHGERKAGDVLQRYTGSAPSPTPNPQPKKYQWRAKNTPPPQTEHLPQNECSKPSPSVPSELHVVQTRNNALQRTEHNTALKKTFPEHFTDETKIYQRKGETRSSKLPQFMKSQIYFDFVPPSLNHFEYTMKELAGIEKSINRALESESFPTTVSKYLSFTFIYGNHLDMTEASLKLFNAEPEDMKNEANRSKIVVIFLDKEVTFETLEEITKNTRKLETRRGSIFLVVQSSQLLKDQSRLKNILKGCFEKQLRIIDFNTEMKTLFDKFSEVKDRVILCVKKMLKDAKLNCKDGKKLDVIEQRLLKLCQRENKERRQSNSNMKKESLNVMDPSFLSLKDKGLRGYTLEDDTLLMFFKHRSCITEDSIPPSIKEAYPSFKIIEIKHRRPLFTLHHRTKSGEKLYPWRNKNSYGSVGMFCNIRDKCNENGFPMQYCIASPHVISSGQRAYILNERIELGKCEWPQPAEEYLVNVQDISVIRLNQGIQIDRNLGGQVLRFRGDRSVLDRRKVIKFGASTKKTIGYVSNVEFVLMLEPPINVYLIEPDDTSDKENRFSLPGDSGAIVLTKFGQNFEAVSMIFGGVDKIQDVATNNSIAVDLNDALNNYENSANKIVELDTV
ncbi:uncharacterized protein LOC134270600 [Saccostrea cucullata]|uniref:uncharacterized protein LOC134270600 n=1 Tax=Saccostrea cuccullata TaxID=36930 RepID=UPI002ED4F087